MAVEVVRRVLCDICLKRDKTKTEADQEEFATVLTDGHLVSIDLCEHHMSGLTYSEILSYGYRKEASREGKPPKDPKSAPTAKKAKELVQCSWCHQRITRAPGWTLHNKVHLRNGITSAEPLPVVEGAD